MLLLEANLERILLVDFLSSYFWGYSLCNLERGLFICNFTGVIYYFNFEFFPCFNSNA